MTMLSIVTLSLTIVLGLLFFGLFCWAVKDGQFDDAEEAKYEIFRDYDDETGEKVDEREERTHGRSEA